ncbi:MAG: hypothetical protein AABX99_02280, partial [Nanoarchaeota archaeon]
RTHQAHHKKRSTFHRLNHFSRKHPLIISVILILASLILFRLSFTNSFLSSTEIFMWSIILSLGLFLAGFLVLVGWWRNHVAMFTTHHNVNWKTH